MLKHKRSLAPFYTPEYVAQVLTDWAIRDPDTTVLDPSFGGCSFLNTSLSSLRKMGIADAASRIFGVDIDPDARQFLEPLLASGARPEQFVIDNFFNITPEHFGAQLFGAIVGNPPYIRYHAIPDEEQRLATDRLKAYGIHISGRASYWALFLLYSMQFLRSGGRLAMVLPGVLLHTDYAKEVRNLLVRHFEEVSIFLLEERVFEGTDEESVLVCAAGARRLHKVLRIGAIAAVQNLKESLRDLDGSTQVVKGSESDGWLRGLLGPATLARYDDLVENDAVVRLGDLATIRIGVVTGNNSYFLFSPREMAEHGIPRSCTVPIIRRPAHLRGLVVTDEDLQGRTTETEKSLLLAVNQPELQLPETVQTYLNRGVTLGVDKAQKCQARHPWYAVRHTQASPAFMQCMSASWPRLVVNRSAYTCTNNILRLAWKVERSSDDWIRLALGTLSTLSQLSAELVGRSYGGGVLKLEPTELSRLPVPLLPVDSAKSLLERVDTLLRTNRFLDATDCVDSALVNGGIGLTDADLARLREARSLLFLRRRGSRIDAQHILTGKP